MHVFIIGICGTLMSSTAVLAQEKGYQVSGYDKCFAPPMSDLLDKHQIQCFYRNRIWFKISHWNRKHHVQKIFNVT